MNRKEPLSITCQCVMLDIPRSTFYHRPSPVSDEELELMRLMDRCHTELPFYVSRRMVDWLADEGHRVNRKHVQRLMRTLGIVAMYPNRNLSLTHQAHQVYPYRLRKCTVDHPDQAGCADITYVPMARGFVYLVAVMDWYSRKVLSWRLSNTMNSHFCVATLEDAIERHGILEVFNTEQGSPFTSQEFIDRLKREAIQISMDGKGRWLDNMFIERLWRSVKYEEVYLKAYTGIADAKRSLMCYFGFYNEQRRHQALDKQTPDEVYYRATYAMAA